MRTHSSRFGSRLSKAFSLVEAVITIAVVGVMASLVVGSISNMSRDTQRIVSRQQQGAVQNALQAWVMSQTRVGSTAQLMSINDIRTLYNAQSTAKGKFVTFLAPNSSTGLGGYLDKTTADHFLEYTTNSDRLKTSALELAKQHLELPTWTAGGFPMVNLVND